MCLLLNCKIVHCELHVFSFSFVHSPVCANCKNDSCNIYSKKKKKKKKKKKDSYFGMGEKYQSYATKPHYLSFLLGKGGNPYVSKLYIKNSVKCTFCPGPSMQIILIQTLCGQWMPKITKIDQIQFTLLQLSHLSSNRRVCNLPLYFQFTTLARELTHRTKFVQPRKTQILEMPCFFTT